MYVKHASGRELASSFARGTEEALSAAGAHCHDIDDSVRRLTANLAELASTGRTEWARVPEKSRPPPDIYDRALRGTSGFIGLRIRDAGDALRFYEAKLTTLG